MQILPKKMLFLPKKTKMEILDKIRGSDHCPMGGIPQCADFLRFYVVTNGSHNKTLSQETL